MEVKCLRKECQWEWNYTGQAKDIHYISCPKCYYKYSLQFLKEHRKYSEELKKLEEEEKWEKD